MVKSGFAALGGSIKSEPGAIATGLPHRQSGHVADVMIIGLHSGRLYRFLHGQPRAVNRRDRIDSIHGS